jgi:methyl-accepting chemotaxis protein
MFERLFTLVRQFSIRQRLVAVFVCSALALLMVGGIGMAGQQHARSVTSHLVATDAKALNDVTLLRLAVSELRKHERDMVIFCETTSESRKSYAAWSDAFDRAEMLLQSIGALSLGEQERQLLDNTAQSLKAMETTFRPIAKKLVDEVAYQAPFFAATAMEPLVPQFQKIDAAASALADQLQTNFDAGVKKVEDASRLVLGLVALATLLALALMGPLTWLNIQLICKPLNEARAMAQRIAHGDLSRALHDVQGRDEVAQLSQALQHMQGELHQLVGEVRTSASSILLASSEVAMGNLDLSQRTERTAASLQQAAASITNLSQAIANSSDAARQANQLAKSAAAVAVDGGQVVGQVELTMNNINASSAKISDITSVIDSIAFQTNILALNAAVEAARAGEQGRGFSVVAAEVRSLASNSAEAAKEIKALIVESVERAEDGSQLVRRAGQTMTSIVSSTQRVTGIVQDMSVAAESQAGEIERVNHTVVQLDAMTQQNAALVEQGAAAAESLKEQASRLNLLVDRFRLHEEDVLSAGSSVGVPQ